MGGARSSRVRIHPLGAGHGDGWGWAASWHTPVFAGGPPTWPGLRVESVTVVRGRYELRVHRILGAPAGSRAEETGWATGPRDAVSSALYGLHGWEEREDVRAPQGTAFTRWAVLPRLGAEDAGGTAVYMALAMLSAEGDAETAAEALAEVVTEVTATTDGCAARWGWDGARTQIGFGPLTVQLLT